VNPHSAALHEKSREHDSVRLHRKDRQVKRRVNVDAMKVANRDSALHITNSIQLQLLDLSIVS
jgi:hypothetical protein